MATFVDYWNELKAYTPNLPVNLAKRIVNRARREIYAERPWSFLFAEANITTPTLITAGLMTVTKDSQTVVPDATALAAVTGLTNPIITRRQIRLGEPGSAGPIYNISGFDGTNITIDKPFFTNGTSFTPFTTQYSLLQAYYYPPSTDFLRWVSVADLANGYELDFMKTREELDRWDPQRLTVGQPISIANFRAVPDGFWDNSVNVGDPIFEIWPHPTFARVYDVIYQRRGLDLVNDTDTLPQSISMDLLLTKARIHAYEWQMSTEPNFANAYRNLVPDLRINYQKLLQEAKVQDDEIFITQWVPRVGQRGLRWLGNYAQSHDLSGFLWNFTS